MREWWERLGGPVKIGLAFGLLGALLTVIGLVTANLAPLTLRSLALGILLGGGSWGLVSWAIASAAVDATGNVGADTIETATASKESGATEPASRNKEAS